MDEKPFELFAKMILDSAAAFENSYDKKASAEAAAKAAQERAEKPDSLYAGFVDYNQFYRLTLLQACEQTCKKPFAWPVYLLLSHTWNDAQIWAEEVLGIKKQDAQDEQAAEPVAKA